MRDEDRLREKIQVSLEDRHVALLAVGALVLLGGVFALGLLVGKQLAVAAPQAAQAGDLAALDAQRDPPPVPPQPARQAQAQAVAQAVAQAAPVELVADIVAAPASKPAPTLKPAPAAAARPKPEDEEDPVPENGKPPASEDAPSLPKPGVAIAPAAKPAAIEPARPASLPPRPVVLTQPPPNLGAFTVQIGASPQKSEAQRLEGKARAAGLKPYVAEANLGDKGTWYRVRVGSFPTRDAANHFRVDVERELRLTAVVMSSH